ncbi:MAG: DUF6403 family protein [Cumulibacter sp.]
MRDITLILSGIVALFLAGYAVTAYLRRATRIDDLGDEARRARTAIEVAEAARDAAEDPDPQAEAALARARGLMSGTPNATSARRAAGLARRADELWRKRARGTSRGSTPSTKNLVDPYATAAANDPLIAAGRDNVNIAKIAAILVLAVVGIVFIGIQTQQSDTQYKPRESAQAEDGSDDPAPAPQPSYNDIVAEYGDDPIITVDGSQASVQEDVVLQWMEQADVTQVVLAPPLDPSAELDASIDVPDDVLLVTGLQPSLSPYASQPSTPQGMARVYGTGDVTEGVTHLLALRAEAGDDEEELGVETREPTAEELAPVLSGLAADDIAFTAEAPTFEYPSVATEAYPEGDRPLIVVSPQEPAGGPIIDYASAVAEAFPDRSVVAMTGTWVDYAGTYADEFERPLTASLYGRFGERIGNFNYSQEAVLRLALNEVASYRHSGIFGKPLPYEPVDPVDVAMPFLPWLIAGLGVVGIAAAIVQVRRSKPKDVEHVTDHELSRLAGLSELAVEVSALTNGRSAAALVRATRALSEAKDVCDGEEDDLGLVTELLDRAERELSSVADLLDRADYQPRNFLQGRWV